jgi:hypothetical protein
VASSPKLYSPEGLNWDQWVTNTALKYEKFEGYAPDRIQILESLGRKTKLSGSMGAELVRQEIESIDPISIFDNSNNSTLTLTYGAWSFSISSWIESLRKVSHAKFYNEIFTFLDRQFQNWIHLSQSVHDDSLFIVSDGGIKFINANDACSSWIKRINRSGVISEQSTGAWCSAMVTTHNKADHLGRTLKLNRSAILGVKDWCGNPNWENLPPDLLPTDPSAINELWVSIPYAGLTLEIVSRLKSLGIKENVTIIAPSTVVGWHPVRDLIMCANRVGKRLFIAMDANEFLHFTSLESYPEDSL